MRIHTTIGRRPFGLLLFLFVAFLAVAISASQAAGDFTRLKTLIESGKYDEARQLSAHASPNEALNEINLAFTEALILKAQGRYSEAAAAMRAILSTNPNLTRVRIELADTLMHLGDTEGASFNMQLLADSATTSVQRSFYDNYLSAIRRERPWSLDAYVALAPSTNINNGISGNTVVIGGVPFDASSHAAKSGVGGAAGLSGTYRFDLSPQWDLTFGAKASANVYADHSFDQFVGTGFSELAYTAPTWRVGLGVGADRTWAGWNGYGWDVGPQLSVRHDLGRIGTLIGTAAWKHLGYDQVSALNGNETDLGLRYLKNLSPSSSFGLGFQWSDVTAAVSFNAFNRYKPSVEVYKELPWGLLTSAQLSYEFRQYKTDFPLMGKPREDRQLSLDLAVTFRNLSWHGFAPKAEYTFARNTSNVELNTYTSHAFGLYITKQY